MDSEMKNKVPTPLTQQGDLPSISIGPVNHHSSGQTETFTDSGKRSPSDGTAAYMSPVATSSNTGRLDSDNTSANSCPSPPTHIWDGSKCVINPHFILKRLSDNMPLEVTDISQDDWNHLWSSFQPGSFSHEQAFSMYASRYGVQVAIILFELRGWKYHRIIRKAQRVISSFRKAEGYGHALRSADRSVEA